MAIGEILTLFVVAPLILWSTFRMSEALTRLTASVAALTNVSQSAVALISGLAEEIRQLNDDGDADGLAALADQLDADSAALSAAITANTPVATAPGVQPDPTSPTPTPADPGTGEVVEGEDTTAQRTDPG